MAKLPTVKTNCGEVFIFDKDGFPINFNLGEEGLSEVKHHCHASKFTSFTGIGVVVHLEDFTQDTTDLPYNTPVVVTSWQAGEPDPSHDLFDLVVLRAEIRRPGLNRQVVAENNPWSTGEGMLEVLLILDFHKKAAVFEVDEAEGCAGLPESKELRFEETVANRFAEQFHNNRKPHAMVEFFQDVRGEADGGDFSFKVKGDIT